MSNKQELFERAIKGGQSGSYSGYLKYATGLKSEDAQRKALEWGIKVLKATTNSPRAGRKVASYERQLERLSQKTKPAKKTTHKKTTAKKTTPKKTSTRKPRSTSRFTDKDRAMFMQELMLMAQELSRANG